MTEPKAIFVTGAASGIGRATARHFARQGWFVGLFDVDDAGLATLAGEIGEERTYRQQLDVRSFAACRDAVDLFGEKSGGRMDVLFNCAGIMRMGLFDELSIEEQVRTIEVNFIGVVNGTYAALPLLKKTAGARIVSMCSASAFYGVPELAVYSATKFAVKGLTEALAIELERHGIAVTDLMPPYVRTPMVTEQKYEAGTVKSLGVGLTPEDISEVVWAAATGRRRIHWVPTFQLKLMAAATRMFPFAQHAAMRFLSRLPARRARA